MGGGSRRLTLCCAIFGQTDEVLAKLDHLHRQQDAVRSLSIPREPDIVEVRRPGWQFVTA